MSQPYWVEVMVEVELRLIWAWGWNKVEMRLSGNLVEIELSWSWEKMTLKLGFHRSGVMIKICFRSTYVAEQPSFSMLLLISFIQSVIFLAFFGQNRLFLIVGFRFKLFWGLLIKCNNFHFLCFLQFWHLILT